jgi:deoxyguanosine kinase
MEEVYLSLGSNMGNRSKNLDVALDMLTSSGMVIAERSSVYNTEPWGFSTGYSFFNMVVIALTGMEPLEVLMTIHKIEAQIGRVRRPAVKGYTSRIIDIDILFYGDWIIDLDELVVPHPRLHERRFVLVPLNEIAPGKVHPISGKKVLTLFEECGDDSSVQRTTCDF